MGRPFDHGELNIPLAKRQKGFHGELDRYLSAQRAAQQRQFKDARERARADAATIKALLAQVSDVRMAELGRPVGRTASQARKHLIARGRVVPELIIAGLMRELDPRRCANCVDWRPAGESDGECWSADRLDGDLSKGPAATTSAHERCEAFNPPAENSPGVSLLGDTASLAQEEHNTPSDPSHD